MHILRICATLLLLFTSAALAAAVARASGCSYACPPSDRDNHANVNTVRKGGVMECYYGTNGVCGYNLTAGKLKRGKSTSKHCRPNAIASCAKRRAKTKNRKGKQAQAVKQPEVLLIQKVGPQVVVAEGETKRRGHTDV